MSNKRISSSTLSQECYRHAFSAFSCVVLSPPEKALRYLCFWMLLCMPGWAHGKVLVAGKDAKTLQATIQLAKKGDVVEVPKGTWLGPVVLKKSITLRGKGGVLDGKGKGKVLVIHAPNTIVESLKVQGSGHNLGNPDSCIYLKPTAKGSILRNNILRDCAFGIWVHEAHRVKILKNTVFGRVKLLESDRGNGIHLFYGRHLLVKGNRVSGARDGIYVSAVEKSTIEGNYLTKQRYGVHYMYSNHNALLNNTSHKNLTGFALMQSHHMTVIGNVASENERHGILFRDAEDCIIKKNTLRKNGEGLFFFSSTDNKILENTIIKNQIGARIWAGTRRNQVSKNAFIANAQQVYYVGAKHLIWGVGNSVGNYWSDYLGWDQDGDGYGDRPYRCDSFTANLLYRFPSSVLLLRSPALELLKHMEQKLPVLRVPTIIDKRPIYRRRKRRKRKQ